MRFQKLVPIVYVSNIGAEVAFYEALGFEIEFQGDEFPDYISLRQGDISFGIELKNEFDPTLANESVLWQFEVDDLTDASTTCKEHGFRHTAPKRYLEAKDVWSMRIWSPSGWKLNLEGPSPNLG